MALETACPKWHRAWHTGPSEVIIPNISLTITASWRYTPRGSLCKYLASVSAASVWFILLFLVGKHPCLSYANIWLQPSCNNIHLFASGKQLYSFSFVSPFFFRTYSHRPENRINDIKWKTLIYSPINSHLIFLALHKKYYILLDDLHTNDPWAESQWENEPRALPRVTPKENKKRWLFKFNFFIV